MKDIVSVHSLDIKEGEIYIAFAYHRYKLHQYLWKKSTVLVEIINCLPMKQGFKNRRWQVKVDGIKMMMLKHRNDEEASFTFYRKDKKGEMNYWKSADHLYTDIEDTTDDLQDPYQECVVYIEFCEEETESNITSICSHPIREGSESSSTV
jgi:hypothetical protein